MRLPMMICLAGIVFLVVVPAEASLLRGKKSAGNGLGQGTEKIEFEGRDMYVHVPANLPVEGHRAVVLVLHGGMGNGLRIAQQRSESAMNLDAAADRYGFMVAYLNGTAVTRVLGADKKGWNAGACCGQPAENGVDDVGYIRDVAGYFSQKYGADPQRIYGIGHSNGAMMVQRVICEAGIFTAGISISGGLEMPQAQCPEAHGRKILALHGQNDESVPVEGGRGKGPSKNVNKTSEAYAEQVFERSGAQYRLLLLPDAEHKLETIEQALERQEGTTLPEKAVGFFDLSH